MINSTFRITRDETYKRINEQVISKMKITHNNITTQTCCQQLLPC